MNTETCDIPAAVLKSSDSSMVDEYHSDGPVVTVGCRVQIPSMVDEYAIILLFLNIINQGSDSSWSMNTGSLKLPIYLTFQVQIPLWSMNTRSYPAYQRSGDRFRFLYGR